ncbi:class I SAM-dependent methyltransferase [Prevotella sp. 10(H)]|uniref:class I SAM-dependent methyltransferase n=1 Tax=Prevotella sp. 10(H) TaxID=1158294 RepID=UPI0004A708E6|nr:class I SAM-dependent methyltransferase [Prevotella sp. 10(H)]
MNEEKKLVEGFDYQMIIDFYKMVSRQGPGSAEVTKKALGFIPDLSDSSKIADIGCGTGGQTMTLARNTGGHITAVDLGKGFIDLLKENAEKEGLGNRITTLIESMDNLPFSENGFDLIWSEGAIYIMGYENGLREWRRFLKQGGYIAVSEVSWITKERPQEIEEFWNRNYADINTVSNKIEVMQNAGYLPVAHFIQPENCWLEHFYDLMDDIVEPFLQKYDYNQEAKDFVESQMREIALYKKYKDYYSYVFYIGQKI